MNKNENVKENKPRDARLWDAYRANLLQHGVAPEQSEWYVKWAEGFAKLKGPLPSRKGTDILRYLEKLAGRAGIKDWQVRQAAQALRFLYQEQLNAPWSRKWEWDKAELHAAALVGKRMEVRPAPDIGDDRLIPGGAGGQRFADRTGVRQSKEKHAEPIGRLRNEIRKRHYSLRTEQAYESWVLRFCRRLPSSTGALPNRSKSSAVKEPRPLAANWLWFEGISPEILTSQFSQTFPVGGTISFSCLPLGVNKKIIRR